MVGILLLSFLAFRGMDGDGLGAGRKGRAIRFRNVFLGCFASSSLHVRSVRAIADECAGEPGRVESKWIITAALGVCLLYTSDAADE